MRKKVTFGWNKELPDMRDWCIDMHHSTSNLMKKKKIFKDKKSKIFDSSIDLTEFCSPIEDQGDIGSCTAQAGVGLVEYMEKRGRGKHLDASRLFLYKVTRNILGWNGDTGAYVRTTLKALGKFGVCPESFWPYNTNKFDEEPSAFCYSYAQTARALQYYRLDREDQSRSQLVGLIKFLLDLEIPSIFGFTVYNFGDDEGNFLVPDRRSRVYGGHAVMCVGYDDDRNIGDSSGAFKIRNSWGTWWGQEGYGWLPYDYVLMGLTADWWTIFSQDYLDD